MKRHLFVAWLLAPLASAAVAEPAPPGWTASQIGELRQWVADAPRDALPVIATAELDRALASSDKAAVDRAASAVALRLARMHLRGCATPAERAGWHILDTQDEAGLEGRLAASLAADGLARFFAGLRPRHGDYALLRAALATESSPARRARIARNMERWRWMPLDLGASYVLVNAASFEASLWRDGARAGTWPVIVGKPRTPTPVFGATITGITFNPWWEIPGSIVRESVGALVRRNPGLARQRGYVWGGGSYRQRPGPGNALGQMKLVMPNPYTVYMHDTPNKDLFGRQIRAFSHGCVRVGDAIGFASTLAQGARTRAEIDAIVRSGQTTLVDLPSHIPVYIAYFTTSARADGTLTDTPDIYGRDRGASDPASPGRACGA